MTLTPEMLARINKAIAEGDEFNPWDVDALLAAYEQAIKERQQAESIARDATTETERDYMEKVASLTLRLDQAVRERDQWRAVKHPGVNPHNEHVAALAAAKDAVVEAAIHREPVELEQAVRALLKLKEGDA